MIFSVTGLNDSNPIQKLVDTCNKSTNLVQLCFCISSFTKLAYTDVWYINIYAYIYQPFFSIYIYIFCLLEEVILVINLKRRWLCAKTSYRVILVVLGNNLVGIATCNKKTWNHLRKIYSKSHPCSATHLLKSLKGVRRAMGSAHPLPNFPVWLGWKRSGCVHY